RNLILCFDGTGNDFSATEKDTNVVKLLSMLDRNHEDQFHYYQTGIGTYSVNEKTVHKNGFQEAWSKVEKKIDEGFASTFDAHIMAGYRFLMRYYEAGDRIYMFGFSRGAYTAKFLARMVYTVGLLCRGNEEMVPFAYRLYDRYLAGKLKCKKHEGQGEDEHSDDEDQDLEHDIPKPNEDPEVVKKKLEKKERKDRTRELRKFSKTFCKQEWTYNPDRPRHPSKETNVKVHFLGLWDCVNSVAVMEQNATKEVLVKGTARIIRHAVAVDERRVKFKAALFKQDEGKRKNHDSEDVKEVWFPGNHGDVGGGWDPVKDHLRGDNKNAWFWDRWRSWWSGNNREVLKKPHGETHCHPCQLSDVPLMWMIKELEADGHVIWRKDKVNEFRHRLEHNKDSAVKGSVHDTLMLGFGSGFGTVLFWNFLEIFPLIKRWELTHVKDTETWEWVRFPLNRGQTRDIPRDAILHHSLIQKLYTDDDYMPQNNHGDKSPCLLQKD
ncbi:hypothetical protein K456DRAFT_1781146, partial [Colletotrichum gloeosporioides 23]